MKLLAASSEVSFYKQQPIS